MERIHQLERKHDTAIHEATTIAKEEDVRRHKLRALLLSDEKALLQDQLAQKDTKIESLLQTCQELEDDVRQSRAIATKQDSQMKGQARDLSMLQAELQSVNSASQDSAKVLVEKLALSRELNLLRPEVDHLKSQLAHQQTLVAEKLGLERQLNSVEVELEAEKKKCKQRALQRDVLEDHDEQDSKLASKVRQLEAKLAAEKKDKARIRKDCETLVSESAAKAETMEQRLDLIKSKLRDTREELKRCQAELNEARSGSTTASTTATTVLSADPTEMTIPMPVMATRMLGKKRRADEMTTEITMPTPGAAARQRTTKRQLKKRPLEPTVVGEKSTFSITPFLNRTKAVDDMSFNLGDNKELDADVAEELGKPDSTRSGPHKVFQFSAGSVSGDKTVAAKSTPKPKGRPRKILGALSVSKKNQTAKSGSKKTGATAATVAQDQTKAVRLDMTLEKVIENEENQSPAPAAAGTDERRSKSQAKKQAKNSKAKENSDSSISSLTEPGKKKRKLAGPNKTLFDEPDEEAAAAAAPAKRQATSKVQLGMAKTIKRVGNPMAVKREAFAGKTFSPLKRDRRGVHASFLA